MSSCASSGGIAPFRGVVLGPRCDEDYPRAFDAVLLSFVRFDRRAERHSVEGERGEGGKGGRLWTLAGNSQETRAG